VWGEQKIPGLKAAGFEDGKLPSVLARRRRWATHRTARCTKVLFATPDNKKVASGPTRWPRAHDNHIAAAGRRLVPGEGDLFEEYRCSAGHVGTTWPTSTPITDKVRKPQVAGGQDGRW
jgi:nitrate reductase (cytochrome)